MRLATLGLYILVVYILHAQDVACAPSRSKFTHRRAPPPPKQLMKKPFHARKLLESNERDKFYRAPSPQPNRVHDAPGDYNRRLQRISTEPASRLVGGGDLHYATLPDALKERMTVTHVHHSNKRSRRTSKAEIQAKENTMGMEDGSMQELPTTTLFEEDDTTASQSTHNRKLLSYTTPTEITLGAVFTSSSSYPDSLRAIDAAVAAVNADTTLLPNTKLYVYWNNTGNSVSGAYNNTKEFINNGAVGILGGGFSIYTVGIAQAAGELNKPTISPSATATSLANSTLYPTFFRIVAGDNYQAQAMLDISYRYGWYTLNIIYQSGTYGLSGAEALQDGASTNYPNDFRFQAYQLSETGNSGSRYSATDFQTALQTNDNSLQCVQNNATCVIIFFCADETSLSCSLTQLFGVLSTNGFENHHIMLSDGVLFDIISSPAFVDHQGAIFRPSPLTETWRKDLDFLTIWDDPVIDTAAKAASLADLSIEDTQPIFKQDISTSARGYWDIVYLYAKALETMINAQEDVNDGTKLQAALKEIAFVGASGYINFAMGQENIPRYDIHTVNGTTDYYTVGSWSATNGFELRVDAQIYTGSSLLASPIYPRTQATERYKFKSAPSKGVPPQERFGPCTAVSENYLKLFIFSGTDNYHGDSIDDMWAYSFEEDLWTVLPELGSSRPSARAYSDCVMLNDEMYLFGGHSRSGLTQDLWKFTVSTGRWRQLNPAFSSPIPTPRMQHCLLGSRTSSNQVYLFGGDTVTVKDSNYFWSFHIANSTWVLESTFDQENANQLSFAAAVCGDTVNANNQQIMYVLGGYNIDTSKIYSYNMETKVWDTIVSPSAANKPMYLALTGNAFVIGDHLWFANGWDDENSITYNQWWSVDLTPNGTYQGHWSMRGSRPTSRDSAGTASFGTRLVTFGGWADDSVLNDFGALDVSNFAPDSIAAAATSPPPRTDHAGASIANTLYIFGGRDNDGPLKDLWAFDMITATWSEIVTTTFPSKRYSHCMVSLGPKLVVLGGRDDTDYFGDLWIFNSITGEWEENDEATGGAGLLGGGRYDHGCISLTTTKFAIHGGLDSLGLTYDDVWTYDYQFSEFAELAITQACQDVIVTKNVTRFATTELDGIMYRTGGWDLSLDPTSDHYSFDFTTNCWTALASFPSTANDISLVGFGKNLYAWGGSQYELLIGDEGSYEYNIETDSWRTIGTDSSPGAQAGSLSFAFGNVVYWFGGWGPEFSTFALSTYYLNSMWSMPLGPLCDPTGTCSTGEIECSRGTYYIDNTCEACSSGTYATSSNSVSCDACLAGKASILTGASTEASCVYCEKGFFASSAGTTSCKKCPPNKHCMVGASTQLSGGVYPTTTVSTAQPNVLEEDPEAEDYLSGIFFVITAVVAITMAIFGACVSRLRNPKIERGLAAADFMYERSHWTEEGGVLFNRTTPMGGVFSMISVVLMLGFLLLILTPMIVNNETETRALVPLPLKTDNIETDSITVTVTFVGYEGDRCVDGHSDVNLPAYGSCSSLISASMSSTFNVFEDQSVFCQFDPSPLNDQSPAFEWQNTLDDAGGSYGGLFQNCSVIYTCSDCELVDAASNLTLEMVEPNTFARWIDYSLSVDSGYPDQLSKVSGIFFPGEADFMLGLHDESLVFLDVTPVLYLDDTVGLTSYGYLFGVSDTKIGDVLGPGEIHGEAGLRVIFAFTLVDNYLEIRLEQTTTFLSIFADILSAFIGILFLLGIILRAFEVCEDWFCTSRPDATSHAQIYHLLKQIRNKDYLSMHEQQEEEAEKKNHRYKIQTDPDQFYFDDMTTGIELVRRVAPDREYDLTSMVTNVQDTTDLCLFDQSGSVLQLTPAFAPGIREYSVQLDPKSIYISVLAKFNGAEMFVYLQSKDQLVLGHEVDVSSGIATDPTHMDLKLAGFGKDPQLLLTSSIDGVFTMNLTTGPPSSFEEEDEEAEMTNAFIMKLSRGILRTRIFLEQDVLDCHHIVFSDRLFQRGTELNFFVF